MKKGKELQEKRFSFRFLVTFFFVIFAFLSFFSSGTVESQDGWLYLSVARNIYYTHKAIAPDQTDYPLHNVNMNSQKGADGIWRSPGSLGYSLSLVPSIALSDVLHRYYHIPPPKYFPLESDWTVLFFASFTNIFFASVLCLLIVLYAQKLGMSKKIALTCGVLTIIATNLLPLSKFGFPQILFTLLIFLLFYLIKRYSENRRILYLPVILGTLAVLSVSYNLSYILALPAFILYYLALQPTGKRKREILKIAVIVVVICVVKHRFLSSMIPSALIVPKVLFEGIWGFLFSSGKSIFLYSPPLILIPIFWHKFKKNSTPELIGFGTLSILFLVYDGAAWIQNPLGMTPIWNSGMVWGPRYAAPLIPGLMLLTFQLITQLDGIVRKLLVFPLFFLGIFVQLLGTSATYLLQYADLPYSVIIGQQELDVYDYASFIPWYSPLWKMPKTVGSLVYQLPKSLNHGPFNVRFYDGFDIPLHSGAVTYRGFREQGHISLSQNTQSVSKIVLSLSNTPDIANSSESAHVAIFSNKSLILNLDLPIFTDKVVEIPSNLLSWNENRGSLDMYVKYATTPSAPHVIYIKGMSINGLPINLDSFDYPYASNLTYATTPLPYQYYGGAIRDPWTLWYMRARVTDHTLDYWWLRYLYYWDLPQAFFQSILIMNIFIISVASYLSVLFYNDKRFVHIKQSR